MKRLMKHMGPLSAGLLTAWLSCLAVTAEADPLFSKDGWIALGGSTLEDNDYWLGGDAMWSTNRPGVGVEFGGFGTIGRDHETYAGLTYTVSSGERFSLGNPRPAYDQFARPLLSDVMLPAALATSEIGFSRLTDGTLTEDKYLPYGLSYAGTDMAMSLHYVENYDTVVLGVAGGWQLGGWRIETALELVDGDDRDANAKLQGARALGPGEVTGSLYVNSANDAPGAVELAYRHTITDGVTLTELVSVPLEDPEDGLAMLGANIYLRGSASLDLSGGYGAGDGLASAALRFEF